MIIKEPDDRTGDIEELQRLQARADAVTAKRIEQEIRQIKAGQRGEAEAAYEMRVHWGDSLNRMVLHDLRIEHGGLVAQIDHLMISRLLDVWVCESKHFAEGVSINPQGEFTAFFNGKPRGVPSPIEQNRKHITILERFLQSGAVKLPTRLGMVIRPTLRSLVLVSKGARISRPANDVPGMDAIVKNDQMQQAISKVIDDSNPLLIAKLVSTQTIQDLAREIAGHHKPARFNWAAKFGLDAPAAPVAARPATPTQAVAAVPAMPASPRAVNAAVPPAESAGEARGAGRSYRCHACAVEVELKVARFCWFNKPKFGGQIYCMDCQKSVA